MNLKSCADLHVHSKFSQNAGDWLLSSLGVNECYTSPIDVYNMAKKRGMDYVTITDHDTIDGALELALMDDFFISEEVTTFFPEDKVKVHVVALSITEEHHRNIQKLRKNIYELVQYLNQEKIVHFIAHPFFRMSKDLTMFHFEKLLLMFKTFEVRNGGKQLVPDDLLDKALENLSQDRINYLENKHNMAAIGSDPWIKGMVGGSDDHGGLTIGDTHTVCPKSEDKNRFLEFINNRQSMAGGKGGSMLTVAHTIYSVTFHSIRNSEYDFDTIGSDMMWAVLDQVFDKSGEKNSMTLAKAASFYLNSRLHRFGSKKDNSLFEILNNQIQAVLKKDSDLLSLFKPDEQVGDYCHGKLFQVIEQIMNTLLSTFDFDDLKQSKEVMNNLQLIFKKLAALVFLFVPYAVAGNTEYRDRHLMRLAFENFAKFKNNHHAGVAVFADESAGQLVDSGLLNVFLKEEQISDSRISIFGLSDQDYVSLYHKNFAPVVHYNMPFLSPDPVAIPPVLDILYSMTRGDYEKIYIHSAGPMGILGILIGKILNIPIVARYPFPLVLKILKDADDYKKEQMFRHLFTAMYSNVDELRVLTPVAQASAESLKIDERKIVIISQTCDFSPSISKEDRLLKHE